MPTGVYERTPEIKAKISAGMMGHPCKPETRAKIGAAHIGLRHTPMARAKIGASKLGKPSPRKGVTLSRETRRKISEATAGERNARWRGGHGDDRYCREWRTIRQIIRKRDMFLCQHPECYKPEGARPHSVHHIDYNRNHNGYENLITLCQRHHDMTIHGDREHWAEFYQELQIRRLNWQA